MSVLLKCRKHPRYMAKRKPTADCAACRFLWEIALHGHGGPAFMDSVYDSAKDLRVAR